MKSKSLNWRFFFFAVVVALLWVGWWFFPMRFDYSLGTDKQGQIGDKFGALNTLFTGLALLAVAYSIKHERDAHREEMDLEKQARKEAEQAHARQVELAADTARMQALPILIGLQRDRIGAESGELCPGWKESYVSIGWARGSLKVLQHVKTATIAQLANEQPLGPGSDTLTTAFNSMLSSNAQDRLDRVNRAISDMAILIEYLETYPLLYSKMRVASSSGALKEATVSAQ